MKLIFIAIFAMLVFNGCDELIKKDVELPITFTVTERIAIPEDYDPKAENKFAAGGTYDILSHPDIANVIGTPDKIKKVKITKIKYKFENFSGNADAVLSGVIGLPSSNGSGYMGSNISEYFEINPVKVAEAILLSNQYTLNGDYSDVNDYLSQDVEFQYIFSGISSHNPAIFNIVLNVTAAVTVEASIDFQGNYN